jgi:hypothetical protein
MKKTRVEYNGAWYTHYVGVKQLPAYIRLSDGEGTSHVLVSD